MSTPPQDSMTEEAFHEILELLVKEKALYAFLDPDGQVRYLADKYVSLEAAADALTPRRLHELLTIERTAKLN